MAAAPNAGYAYDYSERFPAVARLVLALDGALWVMVYPEVLSPIGSTQLLSPLGTVANPLGALWRVLDDTGAVLGELRTPPGFFALENGHDYLLGVTLDSLDVETVVLYDIIKDEMDDGL